MPQFATARTSMVDSQIHTMGVVSEPVLNAFRTVQREKYVPEDKKAKGGTPPGAGETTKVLIVVHPHDQATQNALAEIKAEYRRRFRQIGVFHTDWPARIAP